MVEEEPSKPIGGAVKRDFRFALLFGVLIIIGVVILAFLDYRSLLGLQGVSTIQSFLNAVDAIPNGIAKLINDFFNWLGTFFSNTPLFIGMSAGNVPLLVGVSAAV